MGFPTYLLTPCLNAATTIDHTIWSIVSQHGEGSIRYHVQDGGSTDGTLEILAEWERRLRDMRDLLPMRIDFTFASSRDGGMYDGIDLGFRQMDIPDDAIMGWCNADDTLWQGAVACLQKFDQHFPALEWVMGWPAGFDAYGRCQSIDREPFFPRQIIAAGMSDGQHWPFLQQESTFWRKRLWSRAGGVNKGLKLAGDWDLWRRFAQSQELIHLDRQLGSFHERKGQKSSDVCGYRRECEGLMPAADRPEALVAALQASPEWRVSRITLNTEGVMTLRQEVVELKPFEKMKSSFRSHEYLLRKLKQRYHSFLREGKAFIHPQASL